MATLEQTRDAIMMVESGGRNAPPNNAQCSGIYQFSIGTWANYGGYHEAYQAPPDVQKARATELMKGYYAAGGGDWRFVAIAWFGGGGAAQAWKAGKLNTSHGDGAVSFDGYLSRVGNFIGQSSPGGTPPDAAANPGIPSPTTDVTLSPTERANQSGKPQTPGDIAGALFSHLTENLKGPIQGSGVGGTGIGVGPAQEEGTGVEGGTGLGTGGSGVI